MVGRQRGAAALCVLMIGVVGLAGCGNGAKSGPRTITVPGDKSTIQAAVDAARPGDTVLISAGTYDQQVQINTPRITLRGADRNNVVLNGGGLMPNGVTVTAPGVTVENFTVRGYTFNGVLVTGEPGQANSGDDSDSYGGQDAPKDPALREFAVRYITAYNNGLYGVYAFDSQDGVIEDSYTSGQADSGIYVGQCQQCDIVVRDNVAERNATGYEQTNASDSVIAVHNRFSANRVGAAIESDYQEAFVPEHGGTFAGNLVASNADPQTPAEDNGRFGFGVGITGGQENQILRNRVTGNPSAGISIGSVDTVAPNGNHIEGNAFGGNGVDLAYTGSRQAPGSGNCASGNTGVQRTVPATLLETWVCPQGNPPAPGGTVNAVSAPPGLSFQDVPPPPAQPDMPRGVNNGPAAAPTVDLATIAVPPADLFADQVLK